MTPMHNLRLVIVCWHDRVMGSPNWSPVDHCRDSSTALVHSVGWLAFEGSEWIYLIPHYRPGFGPCDPAQECGSITIRKSSIVSMRDCVEPAQPKK